MESGAYGAERSLETIDTTSQCIILSGETVPTAPSLLARLRAGGKHRIQQYRKTHHSND